MTVIPNGLGESNAVPEQDASCDQFSACISIQCPGRQFWTHWGSILLIKSGYQDTPFLTTGSQWFTRLKQLL